MSKVNINCTHLEGLQALNHLFIDTSRLKREPWHKEKKGSSCELQVATLDSGTPSEKLVAAKTLRLGNWPSQPGRVAIRLARELKARAELRHPHILPLIGFYLSDDYKTVLLISEYMLYGDLKEYIAEMKPHRNERLCLVRDIADGLVYLHTRSTPFRHGDLKPANVLVNSRRSALLADFGLSMTGPAEDFTTGNDAKITLRYASPEILLGTAPHSLSNDIWSWACLVWEALTDREPFAGIAEHLVILSLHKRESPGDVDVLHYLPGLKDMLAQCWSFDNSQRPTAVDCFYVIQSALSSWNLNSASPQHDHLQPVFRWHHPLEFTENTFAQLGPPTKSTSVNTVNTVDPLDSLKTPNYPTCPNAEPIFERLAYPTRPLKRGRKADVIDPDDFAVTSRPNKQARMDLQEGLVADCLLPSAEKVSRGSLTPDSGGKLYVPATSATLPLAKSIVLRTDAGLKREGQVNLSASATTDSLLSLAPFTSGKRSPPAPTDSLDEPNPLNNSHVNPPATEQAANRPSQALMRLRATAPPIKETIQTQKLGLPPQALITQPTRQLMPLVAIPISLPCSAAHSPVNRAPILTPIDFTNASGSPSIVVPVALGNFKPTHPPDATSRSIQLETGRTPSTKGSEDDAKDPNELANSFSSLRHVRVDPQLDGTSSALKLAPESHQPSSRDPISHRQSVGCGKRIGLSGRIDDGQVGKPEAEAAVRETHEIRSRIENGPNQVTLTFPQPLVSLESLSPLLSRWPGTVGMLNHQITPTDAGTSRVKRTFDDIVEESERAQIEDTGKCGPFNGKGSGKSKRIRLSARDLLANLGGRRIFATEIRFTEKSARDGDTYSDVAVATLVTTEDGKGRRVAVKKFRFVVGGDMTEEIFLRVFVNEVLLLDSLSHPNIVEFIGFVEDIENRIAWLVFPWEDNGNLREFLRSGTWEIPERVSLVIDVASGLEYLHTRQPPICHGDLKSLNILVNPLNRAVITDFGSARIMREIQAPGANPALGPAASADHIPSNRTKHSEFNVKVSNTELTLTGPACSFRWAPPEHFEGKPLDRASDIWALGWIAWEATTDCLPFHEVEMEQDSTMRIIQGQLPSIYDHDQLSQIRSLCSIMHRCWTSDTQKRPSAMECRKSLGWLPHAIPVRRSGEEHNIRSVALLLNLGENHRLEDRHDKASNLFEQGLEIARSAGNQPMVGALLDRLGENYQERSKYIEAEACFEEALAIFISIRNELGQANALNGLGDVKRLRSKYVEAEASYKQALEIYTRIGNDLGRGKALAGLGDVQRLCFKYVEAEASYTQALEIYTRVGNDLGRGKALAGLGDVQQGCSKYAEAEASYRQALDIYTSVGDDQSRANALRGIGDVQQLCLKYGEAEKFYNQALDIYKRIENALGQVDCSLELAKIRLHQAQYDEAKTLIQDTATISARIKYGSGEKTSRELLDKLP